MIDVIHAIVSEIQKSFPELTVIGNPKHVKGSTFPVFECVINDELARIIAVFNSFDNQLIVSCQQLINPDELDKYLNDSKALAIGKTVPQHTSENIYVTQTGDSDFDLHKIDGVKYTGKSVNEVATFVIKEIFKDFNI